MIIKRTWPYGTTKSVTVEKIFKNPHGETMLVYDETEAYVLFDKPTAFLGFHQGQKGTITFTQGGPTGGYWKFSRENR